MEWKWKHESNTIGTNTDSRIHADICSLRSITVAKVNLFEQSASDLRTKSSLFRKTAVMSRFEFVKVVYVGKSMYLCDNKNEIDL